MLINRENPFPVERGEMFTPEELKQLTAKTEQMANSIQLQKRMRKNPDYCASTHRLWQCRWFSAEYGFNLESGRPWVERLSDVIRQLEARGYPARKGRE
jgi:hypothetical protein